MEDGSPDQVTVTETKVIAILVVLGIISLTAMEIIVIVTRQEEEQLLSVVIRAMGEQGLQYPSVYRQVLVIAQRLQGEILLVCKHILQKVMVTG